MSFDPKKFINTAEHLSSLNNDEETVRSMIGRAYYAAFGIARDKLKIHDKEKVHKKVIDKLLNSSDRNYNEAGKSLESLRKSRVSADYDYNSPMRFTRYQNVICDANYIIEKLDQANTDKTDSSKVN